MGCPAGCSEGFEPYPALQGKKCLGCGAIWNAMSAVWENLPPGRWVYVLEDGPVPPAALQDGTIEELIHHARYAVSGPEHEKEGLHRLGETLDRLKDGEA